LCTRTGEPDQRIAPASPRIPLRCSGIPPARAIIEFGLAIIAPANSRIALRCGMIPPAEACIAPARARIKSGIPGTAPSLSMSAELGAMRAPAMGMRGEWGAQTRERVRMRGPGSRER
jgi:hypothetical protein